jgi:hypothetical protein
MFCYSLCKLNCILLRKQYDGIYRGKRAFIKGKITRPNFFNRVHFSILRKLFALTILRVEFFKTYNMQKLLLQTTTYSMYCFLFSNFFEILKITCSGVVELPSIEEMQMVGTSNLLLLK